ncbi:MAG: cytochrome c oxidase subunit 3 [Sphingobacteriales bacterium]|jgi:cytochrome c oxidase subunit 3|nr:cytochrome c oxidase subunit 3 [Sphingobacteriales bacterium]MBP9142698.1 cytochrome c oxidase subunit 3 [Chitinophagales bacterium]MDA0198872.1 cytochrome c oxidase subunit 3 [Bacteroidota bacterium]MBK6889774.1 cytochrome c oxidase subunit 3 [Sphingobacteriales bacterium]MBK7527710.1 cytochrome c oxidase subunit 3 [Sphingobacteriales bacterium]
MSVQTIEAQASHNEQPTWNGGDSPFKVSYGKLMMWYFLVSDAFTFSALLIAYGTIRFMSPYWADPNVVFSSMPFTDATIPLGFVSIMTFILILSSVFVVRAVQEGHRMNKNGVLFWMFWGIVGGAAFLGCQAWEWTHLITHNATTVYGNPFGPAAFGQLFFLITGFHGFHVFSGVVINIIAFSQTAMGIYHKRGHYEMIEKVGLYWHFVDLVWVFVFLAFYLL